MRIFINMLNLSILAGMDINEIRLHNLLLLLARKKAGDTTATQASIAAKWDTSSATISQIRSKKTKKNLGDDLARKIEEIEELPRGWFDSIQTTHDADAIADQIEKEIGLTPLSFGEIQERNKGQFNQAAVEAIAGLNEVQAMVIANELRTDEIKRLIRALKPFRGAGEAATPVASVVTPPPRPAAPVVALHPVEANATLTGELSLWDGETPLADDEVAIPLFDEVELAAGTGSTQVAEVPGMMLRFAKATLREAGVRPDKAACAIVRGDSMERLILNGATIGIDLGATEIIDGEIYAFEQDGALRVKYLFKLRGGGLRIHSENEAEYPDETLNAKQVKEIRILGSVFWWSTVRRRRGQGSAK